jgi:hypothetical protein
MPEFVWKWILVKGFQHKLFWPAKTTPGPKIWTMKESPCDVGLVLKQGT